MLRRSLIIIAIISFALMLSANAFGQNNQKRHVRSNQNNPNATQRKQKPRNINTPVNPNNIHKPTSLPIPKLARTKSPKSFASTTQPFADGLRKKGSSTKRSKSKIKSRVNMEDGVFLPGYRSKNHRKPKSN